MELTIGCDPELFIKDRKTGKLISAHGLFPGDKKNPHKVECGAVQVDGMAAEYNIDPVNNAGEFVLNNLIVLRELRDLIRERNPDLDFEFVFNPVADFGKEYIDAQPDEAKILGCEPDYNAWEDGKENPTPDMEMPFRTASGHIHLGWGKDFDISDEEHIEACCMMSKQLDSYIGMWCMSFEGKDGKKRRELYGKAGAFRPKSYGVEYRTMSNVWLSKIYYMSYVYALAKDGFDSLIGGYRMYESDGGRARKKIDDHDAQWYNDYYEPVSTNLRYSNKFMKEDVTVDNLDELIKETRNYYGIYPDVELIPAPVNDPDEAPQAEWVVFDDVDDLDEDEWDILLDLYEGAMDDVG